MAKTKFMSDTIMITQNQIGKVKKLLSL
jgi:hypothetical protein